jgi:hypothetical protein
LCYKFVFLLCGCINVQIISLLCYWCVSMGKFMCFYSQCHQFMVSS